MATVDADPEKNFIILPLSAWYGR